MTAAAGGEASVLGAGAGAEHRSGTTALFSGGDLSSCAQGKTCDAPVRLRLLPTLDGSPPAAEAPAAELAVKKPEVPAAPPSEDAQTRAYKAAQLQIQHALISCLDEYAPDWATTSERSSRLKGSAMFCADGSTCGVKIDPAGTAPKEAAQCAEAAMFSIRVPGSGNEKSIRAMLTVAVTMSPQACVSKTRLKGWKCVPETGSKCPDGTSYDPKWGCVCPAGTLAVSGGGCTPAK